MLINTYYRGLNDNILWQIFNKEVIPDKLANAQKAVILIENLKEWLEHFTTGQYQEATKAPGKTQVLTTMPAAPGPSNTQVDLWPRTSGPMDVNWAHQEGLCWYCGKQYMPGHFCMVERAEQDAYNVWNWVADAMPIPTKAEGSRKKGKGKERARNTNPEISKTLTWIMDTLNIHAKMFESLKD